MKHSLKMIAKYDHDCLIYTFRLIKKKFYVYRSLYLLTNITQTPIRIKIMYITT